MTDLNFKKEYNNASSNKNNMDVFDVYINDWGYYNTALSIMSLVGYMIYIS